MNYHLQNNAPLATSSYNIDCPPSLKLMNPPNALSVLAMQQAKEPRNVWDTQFLTRCPSLCPLKQKVPRQPRALCGRNYYYYASW